MRHWPLFTILSLVTIELLVVHRRVPAVSMLAGQCPVRAVAFPCRLATGTEAASLQLKAHRSWSVGNAPLSVTEEGLKKD